MDREDVADLFREFGPVSVRRVFSGFGVYADEVCFSLYLRGELYLKADAETAPRFAAEGSTPFSYAQARSGKVIVVNSYWRLPERLYDDPEELAQWARIALGVARAGAVVKARRTSKAGAKAGSKPDPKSARESKIKPEIKSKTQSKTKSKTKTKTKTKPKVGATNKTKRAKAKPKASRMAVAKGRRPVKRAARKGLGQSTRAANAKKARTRSRR